MRISGLTMCLALATLAWCPDARAVEEAELATLLEEAREEANLPGLRAAMRLSDSRIVSAAVGLADREANVPLDDTIGMPGGSTGKTFVAAVTMLLVEDGTLSVDDLASKWIGDAPWFERLPNAEEIRVRHLLSHTSGISDYPDNWRWQLSMVWRALRKGSAYFEPEELIAYTLGRKPLFPVGEGYHYTDIGYLVLGRVIEAASVRSYHELVQSRILDPHKLDGIRVADTSILPDIATGYQRGARNLKKDGRMKFDPSSEWTGGGLVTTPTMLVQFYGALAEGRIVAPETLSQMLEAGWRDPDDPRPHYGFGLLVDDGGEWFGHSGLWPGYRTRVTHYMEEGITIAVQANTDDWSNRGALVTRIRELVH